MLAITAVHIKSCPAVTPHVQEHKAKHRVQMQPAATGECHVTGCAPVPETLPGLLWLCWVGK